MLLDADQKPNDVVGENTWELFEAIERSFGVELGDYRDLAGIPISELAERLNDLADYPTREKCLSAVAFYRLRRAVERISVVPAKSIRPATPLREVLPWNNRRKRWKELEEDTGLTLPRLALSGWSFWLCLLLPGALLIFAKGTYALAIGWPSLLLVSFGLSIFALWSCLPLARAFPASCATVGGLAKSLVALNYSKFAAQDAGSSVSDIEEALLLLTAFGSGLAVSEISPATRIPQDLNIY